jgi:hypothetical protein
MVLWSGGAGEDGASLLYYPLAAPNVALRLAGQGRPPAALTGSAACAWKGSGNRAISPLASHFSSHRLPPHSPFSRLHPHSSFCVFLRSRSSAHGRRARWSP